MPVKTVTILVQAMTDRANAQARATAAIFDELRSKSPVEMQVKLDKAQALAESRILARELSKTVNDVVKLQAPEAISAKALAGGQGIGSLLSGIFGKGAGGPAGAAAGGVPPQLVAGGIGAALAALPFLAQAAANSITFVLGGALTGLGIYGAVASASLSKVQVTALQLAAAQARVAGAQDKLAAAQKAGKDNTGQLDRAYAGLASAQDHLAKVQAAWASQQLPAAVAKMHNAFGTLSSDAHDSLQKIGAPFVPVLTLIARMADVVLKDLTPAFVGAEKVIAPAFQMLAVDFVAAFDQPAVVTSIRALAGAFSGMLRALSPQIAGDVKAIASGFTALFKSASSPDALKAMTGFVRFMVLVVADSLQVIAALSRVAGWIEKNWKWDQWFLIPEIAATTFIIRHLGQWRHDTANIFDGVRHDIAHWWNVAWNDTIGALTRAITRIETDIGNWVTDVERFFTHLGSDLRTLGSKAFSMLLDGLRAGAGDILSWVEHFAGGIVGIFKKVWGWFSPSTVMYAGGKALMQGLAAGIKDHAHLAQQAAFGAARAGLGAASGSVAQWITSALRLTGTPLSWASGMAALVRAESGGNPNAVNPRTAGTSGEHAEGIAQTIPSTFAAYAMRGFWNIFNPVDDLIASVRYIKAVYGSVYNIPGLGTSAYQGYDRGGWLMPGSTLAVNTSGRPERVTSGHAEDAMLARLDAIIGRLDTLTGVTAQAPVAMGAALSMGSRSAVYSSLYP